MSKVIQKIKCFFGFHDLIVSEDEQRLLEEAIKTPVGMLMRLDQLHDGTKLVFKICTRCGAKK